ncbi:MAG: HDIG domain-containing metalloprotein [Planctomycetota bacterium]
MASGKIAKKPSSRGKPAPKTRADKLREMRAARSPMARARELMRSRLFVWGLMFAGGFALLAGVLATWAREQPLVAVGEVMLETRLVREPFRAVDEAQTRQAREQARQRTPLVLVADDAMFSELQRSISQLPRTLASVESLGDVANEIRSAFALDEAGFQMVRTQTTDGEPAALWVERVGRFIDNVRERPILNADDFQRTSQGPPRLELRRAGGTEDEPRTIAADRDDDPVNLDDPEGVAGMLTEEAGRAGFDDPAVLAVLVSRVTGETRGRDRPSYRLDNSLTTEVQDAAAERIEPIRQEWLTGSVIYRREAKLTSGELELLIAEQAAFVENAPWWRVWTRRISVAGAIFAVTGIAAGYIALFCPRIRRSAPRMGWVAGLMLFTLAVAVIATAAAPRLDALTAVVPTLVVGAIIAIAYDQRTSIALSTMHALLVTIALDRPVGAFAVLVVGIGVLAWQLADIRHRDTLIRAVLWLSTVLAISTVGVALIDRPATGASLLQTAQDAGLSFVAGWVVVALTFFVLRPIEEAFDVTTGMSLIELRDPKQPLLRELQQRAPGTYNHSLNVASIAEAAADSIGANALLTYAGSLYHDIGKMNKPEYFIENQSGGVNKHEKLSPAMSLLVVVGHVKDGVEIARDHGVPRSIMHFIEAHHGTTLVEYFYHRAQQQAQQNGSDGNDAPKVPDEIEYRYPGPRPRTKEVAIVMLTDAVESATRTMSEPTPSRIEQLVRKIADKRLRDGQFDECELTLRELHVVVESIAASVAAIYHGRIKYPTEKPEKRTPPQQERPATTAHATDAPEDPSPPKDTSE